MGDMIDRQAAIELVDRKIGRMFPALVDEIRHGFAALPPAQPDAVRDETSIHERALEYVFGKCCDWERIVNEQLIPPLPLEVHWRWMRPIPDAVEALVKTAYDDALRVVGEGQELTVTGDGRDDDWRYRVRVARADALNAAKARVMLARDTALAAIRGGAK